MNGRFGGQLLFATAKNGNDNIFPIAMAVVVQKNKDSWIWFLEQFVNENFRARGAQSDIHQRQTEDIIIYLMFMTSLLAYLHNCLLECLHAYMLTFLHACLMTSNAY